MSTHWHGTTTVPGPVDPDGCCKDQPTRTKPTAASIAAGLRAIADNDAAVRLADGLRG